MINCAEKHTYWIIFKPGVKWYCKFLRRGFGHCLILTRDEFNWIICDPIGPKFEIKILPYKVTYNFPSSLRTQTDIKIIKLTMYMHDKQFVMRTLNFFSCVTMTKYMLGLKIFAFTPYMLYKRLHKLSRSLLKCTQYGINSITFM